MLLSDSSDTSCDEDDEAPLTEEDLQEMLWLHKQQKVAQQMYHVDKDVSCFRCTLLAEALFFYEDELVSLDKLYLLPTYLHM